jgi:Phage integrase family
MITRLKGSNSGEHHLNRELARALKAWLKERSMAPGVIFGSKKGGPISRKRLDALVKRYAARAGWPVKLRHCHTFKHACCTHLLSKGFNVEQVQDWVGHANIHHDLLARDQRQARPNGKRTRGLEVGTMRKPTEELPELQNNIFKALNKCTIEMRIAEVRKTIKTLEARIVELGIPCRRPAPALFTLIPSRTYCTGSKAMVL